MTKKTAVSFTAFAAAALALAAGFFASCKNIVDVGPTPVYGVKLNLTEPDTYYDVGDHFSSAGLVVYEVYSDETIELIRDGYSLSWNGSPLAEGSTAITASKGTKKVTVSYDGLQASFYVNVEVTLVSLAVTKAPNKTVYLVSEPLDTTGMVVTAGYDDGSYEAITDYEMIWNNAIISNGNTAITKQAGLQQITVDYAYHTALFEILVDAVVPTSIAVTEAPDKTLYGEDEAFDSKGLIVTAWMNDGTYRTIPAGDGTSGYMMIWNNQEVISGDTDVTDTEGVKLITVEYRGTTTQFSIIVGATELTQINIVSEPNKTLYGTTFDNKYDFTGLTVEGTFKYGTNNNTSTVRIPYKDDDTANGYILLRDTTEIKAGQTVPSTTGPYTIKAQYTFINKDNSDFTKYDEFTIYVIDNSVTLTSIAVAHTPDKTEYITGYAFQSTGLVVNATFSGNITRKLSHKSGTSDGYIMLYNGAEINDGNTTITQTEGDKTIVVSYTFNGETKTADFTVHVTQYTNPVIGLIVTHQPNKTSYTTQGGVQPFDPDGLVITASFSDGQENVISEGDGKTTGYQLIWNGEVISYGNTDVTNITADNPAGLRTINVEYQGINTTFQISVVDYEIVVTGVTVTHDPDKTEYNVGDAFKQAGMVVYASFNDGSYKEIPYSTTGSPVDGYLMYSESRELKDGDTYITEAPGLKNISVVYSIQEISGDFDIMVAALLKYVTITHDPNRLYYGLGEPNTNISTSGLAVTGIYWDGTNYTAKSLSVDPTHFCDASGGSISISTTTFGQQNIYVQYPDALNNPVISSDQTSPVTGHAYFTITVLRLDQRIANDYADNPLNENPIVMYVSETLQSHSGTAYTGGSQLKNKTLQVGTSASQNPSVTLNLTNNNAYLQLGEGSTLTVYGTVQSKISDSRATGLVIGDGAANGEVININGSGKIFAQAGSSSQSSYLFSITQNLILNIADTKICGLITQNQASSEGISIPSWAQYSGASSLAPVIYMEAGTLNLSRTASIAANGNGGIYARGGTSDPPAVNINLSDTANIQACISNLYGPTSYDRGGAVCLLSGAALTISNSASITNSKAVRGGGVYVNSGCTLNIYDSAAISTCSAVSTGGGVYVNDNGALNMDSHSTSKLAVISGCTASQAGGGVYMANGSFTTKNYVSIRKNTAGHSGGGLYYSGTGTLTINAGADSSSSSGDYYTFSGNIAAGNNSGDGGGGIYVMQGNLTLAGTCVVGSNTATGSDNGNGGGVYFGNASGTLIVQDNAVIRGNNASNNGGGIYFAGSSLLVKGNVKIYNDNNANGSDEVTTMDSNCDGGGGIFIATGTATIQDAVQITYNNAGLSGAGINAQLGTTLNILGTSAGAPSISNNSSNNFNGENYQYHGGGGIFSCGTVNISSANLSAAGTVFVQNNTSYSAGGGIFMNTKTGVLNLQGNVEVKGNIASLGGGIELSKWTSMNMYYYNGKGNTNPPLSMPVKYGFPVVHGNTATKLTVTDIGIGTGGGLYMGISTSGGSASAVNLYIEVGRIQGDIDQTDENGTTWKANKADVSNTCSVYALHSSGWFLNSFSTDSGNVYGGGWVGGNAYPYDHGGYTNVFLNGANLSTNSTIKGNSHNNAYGPPRP